MTLPEIVLPEIVLPFDIPVLLHPFVVHFLMALPVVILLLELMNLMMKKKAVGGVSFFLLLLTVFAAVGAYFTGLVDGKEVYPALSETAKSALSEHKLLGTYLMLGSAVVLFFKLLAMTGNKVLKALYIFALIGFVVVMFKQGKEGGELVYGHGMNVQAVKMLDDKIFDLEESLEEALEESSEKSLEPSKVTKVPQAVEKVEVQNSLSDPSLKKSDPEAVQETQAETLVPSVPSKTSETLQAPEEIPSVETVKTPVQESAQTAGSVVPETTPAIDTIPTPQ